MAASALAPHRLLTVDEFDRAWAAGVYGPEERLELIEGEVIQKVSPQERSCTPPWYKSLRGGDAGRLWKRLSR